MSSFVKRPCSEETEADILQQQQEFLKTKSQPSAAVVRLTRQPGDKRKSKSSTDACNLAENVVQGILCELRVPACLLLLVALCYNLDMIGYDYG